MKYELKNGKDEILYTANIDENTPKELQAREALAAAMAGGFSLRGIVVSRATLHGLHFKGDLTNAEFWGCNFYGAYLTDASFRQTKFSDCSLKNCNAEGVDFSHGRMVCCDLRTSNFQKADFSRCQLIRCDFMDSYLDDAKLSDVYSLWDTIGNGYEIITLTMPRWTVVMTPGHIQIGCERHTADEWARFEDSIINLMDGKALAWWQEHKNTILNLHEALQKTVWASFIWSGPTSTMAPVSAA